MTDKIESQLAEGVEESLSDLGVKAMAAKLAPRGQFNPGPPPLPPSPSHIQPPAHLTASSGTIEAKLRQIEQLVAEIRSMASQVKGMLG